MLGRNSSNNTFGQLSCSLAVSRLLAAPPSINSVGKGGGPGQGGKGARGEGQVGGARGEKPGGAREGARGKGFGP